MNEHEYSFPICDLLRETEVREIFELAKPEPPAKLSVQEQLRAAMKEARQHHTIPNQRTKDQKTSIVGKIQKFSFSHKFRLPRNSSHFYSVRI